MEKTIIEKRVEQWFENMKAGRTDIKREWINEMIQTDEHRMARNRYMPFFGNPKAKLVYCNLNPGSANLPNSREDSHHMQFIRPI